MAKAKKKKYSASDKAILGIGYVLLGAFVPVSYTHLTLPTKA